MKVPLNSMTYRLKPVDCFVEAELIVNIVNNISFRQSNGRRSPVKGIKINWRIDFLMT